MRFYICKYYLKVFFVLLYFPVSGQIKEIKINSGANFFWHSSSVYPDSLDAIDVGIGINSGSYGYDLGYSLVYKLLPSIDATSGINYSIRTYDEFDPEGTKQSLNYIGIEQNFYFNSKNEFRPFFGVSLNYLTQKRSISEIDFNTGETFFSTFDMAISFGLSYRVSRLELFSAFHYGLNVQRTSFGTGGISMNTKSRLIRIGLAYVLKGKSEFESDHKKKRRNRTRRRK